MDSTYRIIKSFKDALWEIYKLHSYTSNEKISAATDHLPFLDPQIYGMYYMFIFNTHIYQEVHICIIQYAHAIYVKHTIYSPVPFTVVLFIAE